MLNDILTNLPPLKELGVPISKTGAQSRSLPQMVDAGFHSDHQLLLFPAGLCSRMKNGVIADLPWRKTFISKSVEDKKKIVEDKGTNGIDENNMQILAPMYKGINGGIVCTTVIMDMEWTGHIYWC